MSEETTQIQDFIQPVLENSQVWGLKGEDGWCICDSIEFEETDVMPFFTSKAEAAKLCNAEWQAYTPESINLEEFIEDWLPGMHEDNVMVGIQWNADLEGPELEPAEIAALFSQ